MKLRRFFTYLFFGLSLFFIGSFLKMSYQSLYLSRNGIITRGIIIDIIKSEETLTYYKAVVKFKTQAGNFVISPPLPLQKSFMIQHHYNYNELEGFELAILYNRHHPQQVELLDYRNMLYPLENIFFFLLTIVPAFYFRYKSESAYALNHTIRLTRHRAERAIDYDKYFDPTNPLHVGKYGVALHSTDHTSESDQTIPPDHSKKSPTPDAP